MQNAKIFFWEKKSQLEIWFHSLNFSSLDFIRFTSFFGVGFLLGLLFKRWSKYIILVTLSLAIALGVLHGLSIITINFTTIQRLTGFHNLTNLKGVSLAIVQIVQKYARELGCSGIGFIIGFKTS